MVGNLGVEPSLSWSQARWITVFLAPDTWTTADSNRAPPACKAGALPDELAAQGRRGIAATAHSAGMATCRIWCSRYRRVNKQARSRSGGAAQGWQELNPHLPGFGDRAPIRWLIPKKMKTAPGYCPWGGCLVVACWPTWQPSSCSGQHRAAKTDLFNRFASRLSRTS